MTSHAQLAPIAQEYCSAELGDLRRTWRFAKIAERLSKNPQKSFPKAFGSSAALEGFYRFINNDAFGLDELMGSHADASLARTQNAGTVLAIHDSTQFTFTSQRDGFGATTHGSVANGFLAHMSLLVAERDGTPLGVTHVETWTRTGTKERQKRMKGQKKALGPSEFLRWQRGVTAVECQAKNRFDVIHVADAESDAFDLMAAMVQSDAAFVIRCANVRRVVLCDDAKCTLGEAAASAKNTYRRQVQLTGRRYTQSQVRIRGKRHPQRAGRVAQLAIGAVQVVIPKPSSSSSDSQSIAVACVRVWEPAPVPGQPEVEWILLTNLPASTSEELARVVDIYRRRWLIEEYFKALKTGCAIEERQVESYEALVKVLAIFIPIAHRLLFLRHLHGLRPEAKPTEAFSKVELKIMLNSPSNRELPPPKNLEEAMLHLARLGGHLRHNGKPGWLTLGRGYEELLLLRQGWEMAKKYGKNARNDQ